MNKTSPNEGMPKSEPEVRRAKGRRYVARCNRIVREPYNGDNIFEALELAEQAYDVHTLPYEPGLSAIDQYPPDRFTWICDDGGPVKDCVKIRDSQTGRLVVWPHWFG